MRLLVYAQRDMIMVCSQIRQLEVGVWKPIASSFFFTRFMRMVALTRSARMVDNRVPDHRTLFNWGAVQLMRIVSKSKNAYLPASLQGKYDSQLEYWPISCTAWQKAQCLQLQ
jgi:hypothetical protein